MTKLAAKVVKGVWNPNTETGQQWMAVKAMGFARLACKNEALRVKQGYRV